MAKSKPAETPDLPAFAAEINTEFNSGTVRGWILVIASYIDLLLKDIIAARLVDCRAATKLLSNDNDGPLSTFSARIDAALAIGVIDEGEYTALGILRGFRNECAHRIVFDLEERETKSKIDTMVVALDHKPADLKGLSTKLKLRNICIALIARLSKRPLDAQIAKLTGYDLSKYTRDKARPADPEMTDTAHG